MIIEMFSNMNTDIMLLINYRYKLFSVYVYIEIYIYIDECMDELLNVEFSSLSDVSYNSPKFFRYVGIVIA